MKRKDVVEITVGLDEKEQMTVILRHFDKQGNVASEIIMPFEVAKIVGYKIAGLCYKVDNNLKIPPEEVLWNPPVKEEKKDD